jgi:hypothetical protein
MLGISMMQFTNSEDAGHMIHQVTFDEANKEIVDELQKLQLERPQQ